MELPVHVYMYVLYGEGTGENTEYRTQSEANPPISTTFTLF